MLSSWYGSRYAAVDSNVIDTVLPIFWAEETSEADASQLKGFRKMLMAQLLQKFLDHAAAPLTAAAAFFGVGSMLVGALVAQPVATWHDEEEAIVGERDPLMGGGGAALPAVGSEATRPTENEEIALQSDDKD